MLGNSCRSQAQPLVNQFLEERAHCAPRPWFLQWRRWSEIRRETSENRIIFWNLTIFNATGNYGWPTCNSIWKTVSTGNFRLFKAEKSWHGQVDVKGNGASRQQDLYLVQPWRLWPVSKMIEFMHSSLDTHQSTSEVKLDARNLFAIWFELLLHQTWANLVWCSLMRTRKSTAKFIWTGCRKKFILGSQKLWIANKSSYRTELQLTLRSLSLRLWVRRSRTETGGFSGVSRFSQRGGPYLMRKSVWLAWRGWGRDGNVAGLLGLRLRFVQIACVSF